MFSHEVEVDNLYTCTHTYICYSFGSSFLGKDMPREPVMTWVDAPIPQCLGEQTSLLL